MANDLYNSMLEMLNILFPDYPKTTIEAMAKDAVREFNASIRRARQHRKQHEANAPGQAR